MTRTTGVRKALFALMIVLVATLLVALPATAEMEMDEKNALEVLAASETTNTSVTMTMMDSLELMKKWLLIEVAMEENGTEREMVFPVNGTFLFTGNPYRISWTGLGCSERDKVSIFVIPQGIAPITPRWEVMRGDIDIPNCYDWELSHLETGDYKIIFVLDFVIPWGDSEITIGQDQLSVWVNIQRSSSPLGISGGST